MRKKADYAISTVLKSPQYNIIEIVMQLYRVVFGDVHLLYRGCLKLQILFEIPGRVSSRGIRGYSQSIGIDNLLPDTNILGGKRYAT